VPAGATVCPSCGTTLTSPTSGIKFDLSALSQTDKVVGGATLVLFISFFLDWFSVSGIGITGLTAHGYLYLPMLISIALVAMVALQALGLWTYPGNAPASRDQVLLIATTINFVLVLIAFLFKPANAFGLKFGWTFGSFIAIAAAVIAVLPLGRPALAARRGK
jgi:hypothetical protein